MANELVVPTPDHYPVLSDVDMTCQMIMEAAGTNGFGINDLDRVKVPTGGSTTWEVPTPEGVEPMKSIDCIIVAMHTNRAFWAPGNESKTPDCASGDGIVGHGTPGGDCRNCHWNKFGTGWDDAGRAAKSKACKESRRLTFFTPGEFLPKTLMVPPGSLLRVDGEKTDIQTYIRRLLSRGLPYWSVVTRIELVPMKSNNNKPYSIAVFSKVGDIPKDEREPWKRLHNVLDVSIRTEAGVLEEPTATAEPKIAHRIEE